MKLAGEPIQGYTALKELYCIKIQWACSEDFTSNLQQQKWSTVNDYLIF